MIALTAGLCLVLAGEPTHVGAEHQLFVDDASIAALNGVTREFHAPVKDADNPLLRPEKPWEGTYLALNGSVFHDAATGQWRMYYLGCAAPDKYLGQARLGLVCLATSTDGRHWTRPALHQVKLKDSDDNNVVIPHTCCDLMQVTLDPHDLDPARRWKMSTFQYNLAVFDYEHAKAAKREWTGPIPRHFGVCLYWSADGITWTAGPRGVIQGASDVTIAGWDPKRGRYVAYVKTGYQGKRARALAESDDFTTWPKPQLILHADEQDPPDLELYSMEGWPYESQWLGVIRTFHNGTTYQVDSQLVASRDGRVWQRVTRTPFIANGPAGSWDYGYLTMANSAPQRVGDELWCYYGGTRNSKKQSPYVGGIGLARLRVDGFASLVATAEGTVTTPPVVLDGRRLCLNADAAGGAVTVELLSADGQPQPGFAASQPVTGNAPRQEVRWSGGDLAALRGRPVVVRFRLRQAHLYSFWSE